MWFDNSSMEIPLVNLRAEYEELRTEIALALSDVLERQDFILGREVGELEKQMAALCGRRFAIACSSGSDALVLALMALGIGPGDRVIVPAFTFFATASCAARVGAEVVFADIERDTFNLDTAKLPGKGRVIIPVDLFGQVADMDGAGKAAEFLVEDVAQAVLAKRHGKLAGSFGVMSALSFYPTKNLSAYGDAGLIVTDDPALDDRLRRLRAHGASETYQHQEIGLNSRMDTMQAAVLLVKLRHIERWTAQRIAVAGIYDRLFRESGLLDGRVTIPVTAPGNTHVYHQYTIRIAGGAERRDSLRATLKEKGIGTGVYYPLPLHLQPCFAHVKSGPLPESERAAREVLSLPVYPGLELAQQERVVAEMKKALG